METSLLLLLVLFTIANTAESTSLTFYQQQPFYNIQIPFLELIHGGLQVGSRVIVSGRVLPGADRFRVNLQCGSQPNADIALHFNPRYGLDCDCVVLNSFQNGHWKSEERSHEIPFASGQIFILQIEVTQESYKIFANGRHFMDFSHRIPFNRVDYIDIIGKVEVISVVVVETPEHISSLGPIHGGLQVGKSVIVSGRVLPGADWFDVNLQCGSQPNADIALHFNPRYGLDCDCVVLNSFQNGHWKSEERSHEIPFASGQIFILQIEVTQESYKIFTNGRHFMDFSHRIPFNRVDYIDIIGKVEVISVVVETPEPDFPPQPCFPGFVPPPAEFPVPSFPVAPDYQPRSVIGGAQRPGGEGETEQVMEEPEAD